MNDPLKNGAMTIQRAVLLDGLRALYLTQYKFDRFLKEDGYACGYREGFEDALLSLAHMVGVSHEFEAIKKQYGPNGLPIYNANAKALKD